MAHNINNVFEKFVIDNKIIIAKYRAARFASRDKRTTETGYAEAKYNALKELASTSPRYMIAFITALDMLTIEQDPDQKPNIDAEVKLSIGNDWLQKQGVIEIGYREYLIPTPFKCMGLIIKQQSHPTKGYQTFFAYISKKKIASSISKIKVIQEEIDLEEISLKI